MSGEVGYFDCSCCVLFVSLVVSGSPVRGDREGGWLFGVCGFHGKTYRFSEANICRHINMVCGGGIRLNFNTQHNDATARGEDPLDDIFPQFRLSLPAFTSPQLYSFRFMSEYMFFFAPPQCALFRMPLWWYPSPGACVCAPHICIATTL